jgi:hypothetical protein
MLGSEIVLLSEEVSLLESRLMDLTRTIGKWQNRCEALRELLEESTQHCPHELRVRILETLTTH